MNIKTEEHDGTVIVTVLESRFTNLYAGDFRDRIESLVDSGSVRILVDLDKVTYMDSAGLGSVISSYNYLQDYCKKYDANGNLIIYGLNDTVGMLFSMLNVDKVMQIADDKRAALALLN